MAKLKSQFECQQCGATQSKWSGQCLACQAWNSLVETAPVVSSGKAKMIPAKALALSEIPTSDTVQRMHLGSQELSLVVGGGLVPGSVTLLTGEPGIGKSTLLSQLTLFTASKHGTVLYVTGEESPTQVNMRLDRLSSAKKTSKEAKDKIFLLPETRTEVIAATIEAMRPSLTIVDSIQTLSTERLSGMAGSVGQVRESGNILVEVAKRTGSTMVIVGHVTKEGQLAGPKIVEHMVDTVLFLSGERSHDLRLLRSLKNRFGAVDEVGVFRMGEQGLVDVVDPSGTFVGMVAGAAGAALTITLEGTRPLLIEIQALVHASDAASPRRVATGIEASRLLVLTAVLSKHLGLRLHDKDVFVNVAGGLKVREPAIDLAICAAIYSSVSNQPLPGKTVLVGEVGLLGEIRPVGHMDKRSREAKKLGFSSVIGPETASLVEVFHRLKTKG